MKALVSAACLIGGSAVIAFWLFGLRVIVIQPIGALPDGATVIMSGVNPDKVNWIDSPDALCQREIGGVSLLCRAAAIAAIGHGKVYARLPFSETLFYMTGAPHLDR